jgi:hypothetical protein
MSVTRRFVVGWVALVLVLGASWYAMDRCLRARLRWGVDIEQCPDGDVAVGASVEAWNLRRGEKGEVRVGADLLYALPGRLDAERAPLSDFDVTLTLKRGDTTIPIVVDEAEARRQVANRIIPVTLPRDLQDGDYRLVATVTSSAGSATAEAPLPVYAPARVHVVTDRPLYEPGNTIQFRAVLLRARDLVPLDGRPGRFQVRDPAGVIVLDERADAGEFGVADGALPLDRSAPEGRWTVRYESGDQSDEVGVDVRPFTLPRFTVSAMAEQPFYGAGDEPRVRVTAKTAAGVPMAATVRLDWRVAGEWPAPPEWLAAMPTRTTLPRSGTTMLTLPKVPADLLGKATLIVTATASDDTGDEESGSGAIVLSKDAIDIAVVTELGQGEAAGLVEGTNNRVYLRATTAAGVPLPGATLTVTRAWDKKDKGVVAVADEDGVAALQLDPGPAVNVVLPVMPLRLPPPPPEVERLSARELVRSDIGLADLTALDALNGPIARCSRFVDGDIGEVTVTAQVEPSGLVRRAVSDDVAGRCIADVLRGRSVGAGGARIFALRYRLRPSLARLSMTDHASGGGLPAAVAVALGEARLDARGCLGRRTTAGRLGRIVSWEVVGGRFSGRFIDDARGADDDDPRLEPGVASCIEARLREALRDRTVSTEGNDKGDRFGIITFAVDPVTLPDVQRGPRAQTRLGYELLVRATATDGKTVGSTKVFVAPGAIPDMRLRATPVIAEPGASVVIDLVRGPSFSGEFPKKLTMRSVDWHQEVDVDREKKRATFALPKDRDGWFEVSFAGAMARVFVPKQATLQVAVTPDKASYRPGEQATLAVTTTQRDGAGIAAAVGLFGVDETLGQLATLTGPDAMDRVAPTVTMSQPAFGVLDAVALSLGRVRGKNAAAATVLFVQSVPSPEAIDVSVGGSGASSFDPLLPLADRFYGVLEALHAEVRAFEASAPKEQRLTAKLALELWDKALVAAARKGVVTTDVYGRPLRLQLLPDELVAMTDPRLLVGDGTRLPEDVEAWIPFVRSAR